jgi:hypothetical protein
LNLRGGNVGVGALRDLIGLPSELDDFRALGHRAKVSLAVRIEGSSSKTPHVGPRLGWSQAVQTAWEPRNCAAVG